MYSGTFDLFPYNKSGHDVPRTVQLGNGFQLTAEEQTHDQSPINDLADTPILAIDHILGV
jgi:hypothetical protein